MQTGLEVLLAEELPRLRGRRLGLLAHPPSVDGELRHAADLLVQAGLEVTRLFGPEHGIRGEAQDMIGVDTERDPRLGIPVHSLYGSTAESLRPTAEMLDGLDLLLIDLQDIGSRYYTYVWTALLALEPCVRADVEVWILDRPNPLGGELVEGPTIEPGFTSFVGWHPVPVRHGLTIGELVCLAAAELGESVEGSRGAPLEAGLRVVPMRGWRREQLFDETGLPWVLPSPNMPTLDTALVYPGGCLIEGTNLSEGRGTTRPFEIVGAPTLDGTALAEALAAERLPGVRFRPLSFRPTFGKHAGQVCGGVQLHVTDRRAFASLRTGVALLRAVSRLSPAAFGWREKAYEFVVDRPAIDLLAGGDWLRRGLAAGASLDELCAGWAAQERAFAERRAEYLLY
jgi:uncharacterized protein YbbC (DUF1343 family)